MTHSKHTMKTQRTVPDIAGGQGEPESKYGIGARTMHYVDVHKVQKHTTAVGGNGPDGASAANQKTIANIHKRDMS